MTQQTSRPADPLRCSLTELPAPTSELCRSKADLERLRQATEAGFELLDLQTNGELRLLVEQACDELAALVDLILAESEGAG
jgi:hypothetical protein